MEKLTVILAEDDDSSRLLLSKFIEALPEFEVIGEASTGEELVDLVMIKHPDLALVDIHMPVINGVEAVRVCKKIFPSLQVIFTTGSVDFAVDAFNVSAVDYLVKPIERLRLYVALEKAKKSIRLEHNISKKVLSKLTIKSNNAFIYLDIEDILFIEKEGRKCMIHTVDNQFVTTQTLQELIEQLPGYFYKSHRSYIINIRKVEKIAPFGETYLAYFASEKKVAHISKLKINDVHQLLGN
ncbi:LytR/AlgR family response regulator transcription factor [Pseudoneobacillus sp. C159]